MATQLAHDPEPNSTDRLDLAGNLAGLRDRWAVYLLGEGKSKLTIKSYRQSVTRLIRWLEADPARPQDAEDVTHDVLASFFADHREATSPATAGITWRSLQQFWKWWTVRYDDELPNPMAKLKQPKVVDKPVPIIPQTDLDRLLATVAGKDIESRRDAAILNMFIGTGARLAEVSGVEIADLDMDRQLITVLGKGGEKRTIWINDTTHLALEKYLRLRRAELKRRELPEQPALWLGTRGRGPLGPHGVYQMVKRRAAQAGLNIYPHQFRHTQAHLWRLAEGDGTALMKNNGWKSHTMLLRYGDSAAQERAQHAAATLGIGDKR